MAALAPRCQCFFWNARSHGHLDRGQVGSHRLRISSPTLRTRQTQVKVAAGQVTNNKDFNAWHRAR
jgi:hypothetical protein